jgi:Laminin B (Domain IV)/PEP-CTERM motif
VRFLPLHLYPGAAGDSGNHHPKGFETMRKIIKLLFTVSVVAFAAPVSAATLASSNFATGNEGWTVGEFQSISGSGAVAYDTINKYIQTADANGYNAFVAPSAYLGNQSAAFGGTINFSLSDALNDFPAIYSPLTLISGLTVLYALPSVVPSTNPAALTPYSITLLGANFRTGDLGGGAAVTDLELQSVLASLGRVGINADWRTGSDLVTLDSVSLCDTGGCSVGPVGGVPEPASWALMIAGFGLVGSAMRKRQRTVTFSYA